MTETDATTRMIGLLMDCKKIIESMMPFGGQMANVDWALVNDTLIELQRLSKLLEKGKSGG